MSRCPRPRSSSASADLVAHGFRYRSYERLRGAEREEVLRPTVSFTIQLPNGEAWSEDALIDTGSPACLFTLHVAEAIGVRIGRPGAVFDNFEILGRRAAAQKERVRVTLNQWPDLSWDLDAWFFVEDWSWSLQVGGIFGTEGFLTQWAVTMLRPLNMFVIASPDSLWKLERGTGGRPEVQPITSEHSAGYLNPMDPEVVSPLLQYQEDWDSP